MRLFLLPVEQRRHNVPFLGKASVKQQRGREQRYCLVSFSILLSLSLSRSRMKKLSAWRKYNGSGKFSAREGPRALPGVPESVSRAGFIMYITL